jgi:hypothetical protein
MAGEKEADDLVPEGAGEEDRVAFLCCVCQIRACEATLAGVSKKTGERMALPINAFRDEIVSSIARNTVTIVKGDTGSGG